MTRDSMGGFISTLTRILMPCALLPACGGAGQYGDRCAGPEACESRLCVLVDGNRGICSLPCDAAPCPPGSACVEGSGGARVCLPGGPVITDGGVAPAPDQGSSACASNNDCLSTQYCDRDQGGRGTCVSCQAEGCGDACQVGTAGKCVDTDRLLYCYQGKTRIVDCSLKGQVCGSRSLGVPQCESPAPACMLSQCTANGFTYSCGTNNRTITRNYGGPGPDGLRSIVVRYSNGRTVTCIYSSPTRGSCMDDTGARCTF